ncbi:MAG: IS1380 family transposase [Acidobacteria bacterium]|nr:IS1380 family transposase [Acidobacteriota bacterium]
MSESLTQFILPIKLEKSSERLTSLGGLVVLEEMARALKVWEKVDGALEGPKSGRGYEPDEFVQPLVGMLHAGGRRPEELRELRGEREVLERLGLEAVPDAGTVGDWLRRQGMTGAAEIAQVSQELIAECLNQEPEALTLDVDATEIEAEKQEAQWTYQQVKGYRPLVGYGKGWCVGHEFGEGSPSPGAGIGEFARQCEAALPEGKRIYFRSESAAYPAAVINQYSQAGRSFTITADLDQAVRREIAHRPETAWKPYRTAEGLATDREIAETVHTMGGTEQAFRLIVLRWPNPQPNLFEAERYCYHAVATPREEPASAAIRRHNQRGQCENWHKELKAGLGMEQMPCGEFEANALYFAIGVLAYNLAERLKRRGLPESYRTVTVATLRWKLDRLAAKLVRHARGWVLQVKADLEKWRLLESARAGCAGLGN